MFSKKITALLRSRKTAERTRVRLVHFSRPQKCIVDFLIPVTRGSVSRARELSSSHTNLACFLSRTCFKWGSLKKTRRQLESNVTKQKRRDEWAEEWICSYITHASSLRRRQSVHVRLQRRLHASSLEGTPFWKDRGSLRVVNQEVLILSLLGVRIGRKTTIWCRQCIF